MNPRSDTSFVWYNLIMYAKVAWEGVIKYMKISTLLAHTLLHGFNQTWGAREFFVGGIRSNQLELETAMYIGTLNVVFSVTCHLELRNTISIYCISHILPIDVKLVVWTL